MRLFELDGRLSLCSEFVRRGSRLADIGTDHAYLPVYLAKKGVIKSALACDINDGPLKSAKKCIEKYAVSDMVTIKKCDGLSQVDVNNIDDIVIAGMGGELIADILSKCDLIKDSSKHLILQPMTKYEVLTKWLYKNGFEISSQKVVYCDKKYYTVMLCQYCDKKRELDLYSCLTGKLDIKDENSKEFLKKSLKNLENKFLHDKTLKPTIEKLKGDLL